MASMHGRPAARNLQSRNFAVAEKRPDHYEGSMQRKAQGYLFTLSAVTIFAIQDGLSKYLGTHYSPVFVTMIRFWAFAGFAIFLAARSGGLRRAASTRRLGLQILRGVLLSTQIVMTIIAFTHAGLAMSQAIFQGAPLLITLLSVPLLGEKVGWRRLTAIFVGLCGVILIINPASAEFTPILLLPLFGTLMFAVYGIATRAVGRVDRAMTSFFYTGVVGAVVITLIGPFYWTPLAPADWLWMAALCVSGMTSHYFLIRAYDLLEASEVQPLTYLQLVIGSFIAVTVFNERLTWNMVAGAVIVVGAGLFTVWREHHLAVRRARAEAAAAAAIAE